MSDNHRYELDVKVTAADGSSTSIHREITTGKASTKEAADEFWSAVGSAAKAKMSSVSDGK